MDSQIPKKIKMKLFFRVVLPLLSVLWGKMAAGRRHFVPTPAAFHPILPGSWPDWFFFFFFFFNSIAVLLPWKLSFPPPQKERTNQQQKKKKKKCSSPYFSEYSHRKSEAINSIRLSCFIRFNFIQIIGPFNLLLHFIRGNNSFIKEFQCSRPSNSWSNYFHINYHF